MAYFQGRTVSSGRADDAIFPPDDDGRNLSIQVSIDLPANPPNAGATPLAIAALMGDKAGGGVSC